VLCQICLREPWAPDSQSLDSYFATDGFKAFQEARDPFDPATAQRLHDFVYSAGGTRDYAAAYRAFRGRDPHIEALLEGRGLLAPAA